MSLKIFFLSIIIVSIAFSQPKGYEGFGSVTKGGEGKPVYHVTSLSDDGSFGTLRDALSKGNRYIVFDIAGTIVVNDDLVIKGCNITIDGSTAPSPGITIKKSKPDIVCLVIAGVRDIIVKYIRVQGMMDFGVNTSSQHAGTILIGDPDPESLGIDYGPVKNVIIDHVTARNAIDAGLDFWGEISDVTIQYCLIAFSDSPQTISHYSNGVYEKRRNISLHHNIYARNGERNPQVRADTRTLDYVNNIVYDWGYWGDSPGKNGYGIRIKNRWMPDEPKVTMNIINNAFIATRKFDRALIYGKDPGGEENDNGPEQVLPQGTVYTESDMDSLYVSGNLLPKENMDHYSTTATPLPIPNYAMVTTYRVSALADSVVPFVGTHYPLEDEQKVFTEITDSLRFFEFISWERTRGYWCI